MDVSFCKVNIRAVLNQKLDCIINSIYLFMALNEDIRFLLPNKFDLSIYHHINNQALSDHINRVGNQYIQLSNFRVLMRMILL